MQSVLLSLHIIHGFQMTGLLRGTFFKQQEAMYVFIYLNNDGKPQAQIGISSGHMMLNDIQWFILVTSRVTYRIMKYTILVTRVITCPYTLNGIYISQLMTMKSRVRCKQRRFVTSVRFSKGLHR